MSEVTTIKTFIDTISYKEKIAKRTDLTKGLYPFVTISRQTGAGGNRLAKAIVKEMEQLPNDPLFQGWQILDREICERLVADPELKVSMESLLS